MQYEIVGVLADFWQRETGQPEKTKVIVPAERLAGQDAYEFARYLSSGFDDGAVDYSIAVGGGTMVREAGTNNVFATYVNGERASLKAMPFCEMREPIEIRKER